MAKAATTVKALKTFHNGPLHFFNTLHNKLCNAVTALYAIRSCWVGIQNNDLQFSAIASIYEPRSIHHRNTVLQCQATAWQYEACVPLR